MTQKKETFIKVDDQIVPHNVKSYASEQLFARGVFLC